MNKKAIAGALGALVIVGGLTACSSDADTASKNLSKDADNFKIERRIVFYNGITGDYILEVDGLCSVDPSNAKKLAVTCKTGPNEFKKHFLGVSDNVTWFAQQVEGASVSTQHYKVIFKPSTILPDVESR